MWSIQLLGRLAAHSPQRHLNRFRTQKAASLLAYLAFYPTPQPRETLLDRFWPDLDMETGRHSLSKALSFIRHLLEPPGVPPGAVLLADRYCVQFNPAALTTDVAAFEQAVHGAEQKGISQEERQALLEAAATLYQGPLLPGFYDEWIPSEALRLESLFVQVVVALVPQLLEAGQVSSALAHAQQAITYSPLNEEAMQVWMQALAASGQPDKALRGYRAFAKRLQEEMDIQPSEELQSLAGQLAQGGLQKTFSALSHGAPSVADTLLPQPPPLHTTEEAGKAVVSATLHSAPAEHLVGGAFLLRTTTRFFGREEEMAQLDRMLSSPRTRLVTLTGPGGTGKTRLALEVAAHLTEKAGDPQHRETPTRAVFVSLAEVTHAERLFEAILWALGILPDMSTTTIEQLTKALGTQPYTLLVLDNFEQIVEEGALLVRDLLARIACVKILVTSRQTLDLEGEQTFHLSALPVSTGVQTTEELMAVPSVALFVDRAQAVLPDFQLTAHNAAIVAQLCDYLEGLPLAIELAAARVALLSPARILEQVQDDRLDFLATRRRDAASRQRTLRAALDWSYRLLPDAGRRLLRALSVGRGGWMIEAAQVVGALNEGETLELLTLLRDSSLIDVVDTEDGLRFQMLETIREYAAEQLETSGEKETVCHRHAVHFIDVVESTVPMLLKPEGLPTIRQIGREQANFRAARSWIETHPKDPLQGRLGLALIRAWNGLNWQQLAHWLTEVRDRSSGNGDEETVANLLFALGGLIDISMDPVEAMAQVRQIADLYGQHGETAHQAWTLIYVGHLAFERDLPEGRRALEEAVTLMRQIGSAVGLASALTALSHVICLQGEHERADLLNAEALTLLQDRQQTMAYGQALSIEGHNRLIRGDLVCAQAYFEQSLAVRRRIGDKPGVGVAVMGLGLADLAREDFHAAARRQEEALAIYEETRWDASFFADAALCYLGRARLGLGESDAAAALARKALDRFRQRKSRFGCQMCFNLLAEIAAAGGQDMRAACLLGAGETVRAMLGLAMSKKEQEWAGQLRSSLMARLGEARFIDGLQKGEALREDEAVEIALNG
ncbi:MAG TPA: BTAD domain-containing putative transcriptional regulator [Chthonomonadaceae bacterium]|nr:BTAD domain-containing putative transcriptional regulator [Chthonomonadaceae bacterium]